MLGQETWVTAVDNLSTHARWNQSNRNSATYNPPTGYVIVEHRVVKHSEHWGSASVSVLAGQSKFATSSTFDAANDYLLDLYGKAETNEKKNEIQGKIQQNMKTHKDYTKQFESSHNALHADVQAEGSGNLFDQQSGWMKISVQARLLCIGSPDPKQLAAQIAKKINLPDPATVPKRPPAEVRRLILENQCERMLMVALSWQDRAGNWQVGGWWNVPARTRASSIKSGSESVESANATVYAYAMNGTDFLEGRDENPQDKTLTVKGDTYRFRRQEMPDGNRVILNCDNLPKHDIWKSIK